MKTLRPLLTSSALCLGGLGCLGDLPSPSLVDDLRVLAIAAEPAEAEPGTTVTLDALVVDPLGATPTFAWYACVLVEQGQGFFGGGAETSTSGGEGTPLSTDPYGGSCERRFLAGERFAQSLGTAATATLPIPTDFFDGDLALKLTYGLPENLVLPEAVKAGFLGIAGVNYTVSLVVQAGGRRVEAQKRVNVSLPSALPDNAPNLNPSDLAVHVAKKSDQASAPVHSPVPGSGRCFIGEGLTFAAGERYLLTPVNLPDPRTKYVVLLAGTTTDQPFEIQTVEETWFYSWFATLGSLAKPVSKAPGQPSNTWSFGRDVHGPADLWVVVRDGRGGAAWCHETVTVAPPEAAP